MMYDIDNVDDDAGSPPEVIGRRPARQPAGSEPGLVHRRTVLKVLSLLGAGTLAFRRALAVQVTHEGKVTPEMIKQAEWIAGIELTESEKVSTAKEIEDSLKSLQLLRKVDVGYEVPPALCFDPSPGLKSSGPVTRNQARPFERSPLRRPSSEEDLAFLSVTELSELIRSRQVKSIELTKLYIERLKRY